MRSDNLTFFGETTIRLYGIDYPMKFDISALNEWEQATGKDFAHLSMQIVLMWTELLQRRKAAVQTDGDKVTVRYNIAEEAERLTAVISREDAAQLFYIGAKRENSQVTFEEIQEGVMLDGPYRRKIDDENHEDHGGHTESYPILFVNVVMSLQDTYKRIKKKPPIAVSS